MNRHTNPILPRASAISALLVGACLAFAGCATRSAEQAAREETPAREAAQPRRDPAPRVATIASGTSVVTTLQTPVATDRNRVGDAVLLRTVEPIMASDVVVVPAGSSVHGQVTYINDAGRIKGAAALTLRFSEVVTPDGKSYPIVCEPFRLVGKSDGKQSAEVISGGAVGGAIVGGILGGKDGALKGAAAGGIVGTGVALGTKGDQIVLPVGERLRVTLAQPLSIQMAVV